MPVTEITRLDRETDQWDQAFYAFLAEKERRSGSMRTVRSYSRMLQAFFNEVAKTPERVESTDVFSFAHGIGVSGKRPSAVTATLTTRLPSWSVRTTCPLPRSQTLSV